MGMGAETIDTMLKSVEPWPERVKQPLIFASNFRTGSGALCNIILQEVGRDNIFEYGTRDKETREIIYTYEKFLEAAKENRYPIYYGHFFYGVHRHIQEDCVYFTTVRDPVERVLSGYHAYNLNSQSRPSLKTWLQEYPDANNGMVKRLCGFDYKGDRFDYNQNESMSADVAITEEHLKQAFDVLDSHHGFVFLHSHFVENTVIIQKILGTGPLFSLLHQKYWLLSSTPRREATSQADQELIPTAVIIDLCAPNLSIRWT